MKKKIKILSVFSLAFLLFMTSCEKDLYDEAISNSKVKISKVSLKEPLVFNNKMLMNEVQKIKNKQHFSTHSSSKIVYDSINDFYFDDENGVLIEKENGYKSFTFPIYRDIPNQKLENIVFSLKENNEYEAYISKYTLTESQLTSLSLNEDVDLSNNTPTIEMLSKKNCDTVIDHCTAYYDPDTGEYYFVVTYADPCDSNGGTGNSGDTGNTGTSGTGSTGASGSSGTGYNGPTGNTGLGGSTIGGGGQNTFNGELLTLPVGEHPSGNNNSNKIPCTLVKNLKKDFAFKAKLGTLKNSASSDNFERFSVIYNDPTPNTQPGQEDAYDYEDFQGVANTQGGTYSGNSTMQAVIHSHYQGLQSIFSPDDLQDMYNQMVYPDITDDFFIAVVTAEGTAYILQVLDRQAFINFGIEHLADQRKFDKFTDKLYKKKYNLTSDDKAANEKNFLEMMTDLNMGVSLAGATYNQSAPTSPSLFSNLQVKEIDELTLNVKNINCN